MQILKNQIVAYDYANDNTVSTSDSLIAIEEYSTINVLKLNKQRDKLLGGFDGNLGVYDLKTKKITLFWRRVCKCKSS